MRDWKVILAFILSAPCMLLAQDWNWYIHNSLGKNGVGSATAFIDTINTNKILIHDEQPATNDSIARNDVFIIFRDGTCYSSRLHPRINNSGGSSVFSSFQGEDLYIHTSQKVAKYLYWTNVYDTDDPPPQGFNVSAVRAEGNNSNTVQVGAMQVDSMFAHQDIVAGKDIILVVPGSNQERVLKYNLIAGNNEDILEINTSIFPNSHHSFGSSTRHDTVYHIIYIKPSEVPTYISFKAKTDILNYLDARHTWILYNNEMTEVLDSLSESIRGSHDPNFVYLYNVCKQGDDLYANYMVHFHNDGTAPVSTVSMSFKQNNDLFRFRQAGVGSLGGKFGDGYNCENLFNSSVGNCFVRSFFPSQVTYFFKKDTARILPGRTTEQKQITSIRQGSTGYFLLCLKLEVGILRSWPNELFYHNLRLREPKVYFDGNGFDITTFIPIDHFNPKKNRIVFAEECSSCDCENVQIPRVDLPID